MQEIKAKVCGQTYHLLFNGYAMYAGMEAFGDRSLAEVIQENSMQGFMDLCKVFCLLGEQGELARRYEGYDPGKLPDEEELRLHAAPFDILAMRQACIEAVTAGFRREVEAAETDLGLAELQKKRKNDPPKPIISASEG